MDWRIRATMDEIDVGRRYAGHPTIFYIRLHHGGEFTKFPGRKYVNGNEHYVDLVDIDTFSVHDIDRMMEDLGYVEENVDVVMYYHFQRPFSDLDFGLFALACDQDVMHLATYVNKHKIIDVYTEHGSTKLHTYSMSPNPSKVRIVEINQQPSCSKRLFLEWHGNVDSNQVPPKPDPPTHFDQNPQEVESSTLDLDNDPPPVDLEKEPKEVQMDNNDDSSEDFNDLDNDPPPVDLEKEPKEVQMDNSDDSTEDFTDEESDSDDSDFLVDDENMLDDVEVNMKDFFLNIDQDAEWVGIAPKNNTPADTEEDYIEVIDNDVFLSGSSSDEGKGGERKKKIRAIRMAHENDEALVSEPFYIFQTFSSANEFKERVRLHSIETRRELELEKNDKNRVQVVCKGSIPKLGAVNHSGTSQQQVGPVNIDIEDIKCPWVLYASKWKKDKDWTVKTYVKEHRCLQTRKVKACDYKYLSKQILQQVEVNPQVPVRALQDQLQRQYRVDISKMKTFRAKTEALKQVRGDYGSQYNMLRDYILELQTRNPESTVKLDVESEPDPQSETRTFRRIYVCLGALKKGFEAGKRPFLGLDGAFMKGPYPGQILSAVTMDGNNGIYPVAYAVVEAENLRSWTWFLSNLGDDLGLSTNSNFTFITDRQKGVLPAIANLFPCAENRYCLRHIHENMKLRWKGKHFKDSLWKCATTCNVQQFHRAMEELKKLNNDTFEWLKKIPPQHWARSHFTGRAHCDALLNNVCEQFNSKLDDARDVPIITCLEYIREYIMKKIVNVEKKIQKSTGPLTPTATLTLEKIKNDAVDCNAIFCGNGKYQVSGPWQDQCVVDVTQQICSCKKWELTGIPCKHGIAAIWDMRKNNQEVGIPETWVHPCYWLSTWKDMYSYKIEPINGKSMWAKSPCPTTLLPPKHHATIGRPKKKRKKSAVEMDDLVKGSKASRAHKSVTCTKCNHTGHNARTCKGQGGNAPEGGDAGKAKGKGKAASIGDSAKVKGKGKAKGVGDAVKAKGKGKAKGVGDAGKGKKKGKAAV